MTRDYPGVLQRLGRAVPEFQAQIDDHVAFYDEPLPHVLYGDLTRFVLAARDRGDAELVDKCLTFLDAELRDGDEDAQNLVAASFVENVRPWEDSMRTFIRSWPRALQAEARRQRR